MTVTTTEIRKWLAKPLKELGFLKDEEIYVRELGNIIAALRIYPSRIGSHVYIDIGTVDLRFPHRPIKQTPFWHFNARLHFVFGGGGEELGHEST